MLASFSIPAQARIVCWTNKEGVKECGDKLPPEFAESGHKELDNRGFVVDETAREKTDEEVEEEKRLAEIQAEQDRIKEEAIRRDRILLDTFSNVDDIEMARDGKLDAVQLSITHTEARNKKLQESLDKLVAQAADEEREGKPATESLVKDIESLRNQINTNNEFIDEKHKEEENLKIDYAKDIERFKELKSLQ
jgi:phosphoribosylanthranilate isomerase